MTARKTKRKRKLTKQERRFFEWMKRHAEHAIVQGSKDARDYARRGEFVASMMGAARAQFARNHLMNVESILRGSWVPDYYDEVLE